MASVPRQESESMRKFVRKLYPYRLLILMAVGALIAAVWLSASAKASSSELQWKTAPSLTSVNQMEAYQELIKNSIVSFDLDNNITPPRHWNFVPSGGFVENFCGSESRLYSKDAYVYCSYDDTIYVGADMMWEFYQVSWIAPAILMAHESGHADQYFAHFEWANLTVNRPGGQVYLENQADCISGSWLSWMKSKIVLEAYRVTDNIEVWNKTADRDPSFLRTHGTFAERYASYANGLTSTNPAVCISAE